MKMHLKVTSLLLLYFMVTVSVKVAAQTVKDVFSDQTPVTYLGVDFSKAKLIGDAAADPYELKNKIYPGINQVIINEPKTYDLNKTFLKSNIQTDIGVTEAQNNTVVLDSIKTFNSADFQRFNAATIAKMVKEYSFKGKKGVGLLFIMEAMSKTNERAAVWITFVDMEKGKVLFTERMEGKPGGFGYRNYWVRTINNILAEIRNTKYKQWKATYNP